MKPDKVVTMDEKVGILNKIHVVGRRKAKTFILWKHRAGQLLKKIASQ